MTSSQFPDVMSLIDPIQGTSEEAIPTIHSSFTASTGSLFESLIPEGAVGADSGLVDHAAIGIVVPRCQEAGANWLPVVYPQVVASMEGGARDVQSPGDRLDVAEGSSRDIPSRAVLHDLEQGPVYHGRVRSPILAEDDDVPRRSMGLVTEVLVPCFGGLDECDDISPVLVHYQNQVAWVDRANGALLVMHHRPGLDHDHWREGACGNPH